MFLFYIPSGTRLSVSVSAFWYVRLEVYCYSRVVICNIGLCRSADLCTVLRSVLTREVEFTLVFSLY